MHSPALVPSREAGGKILLVDDDRDLVEILSLRLHLAGFTPVTAFSPTAAMECFEGDRPDVVLLDVGLGPWSGLELLDELRKRSQVPILMLAGCASESIEARSFELGADDYLQKPISARSLIARIRAALSRYQRAQEQPAVHLQLTAALRKLVQVHDRALADGGMDAPSGDEGLALAAHGLLEPLTIIKSVAQLHRAQSVEAGTLDADPIVQALTLIEANASKMACQLVELLSGTRLEIGQVLAREQHARAEAEAAVRLRDEFLVVAAHELKTPLTSLLASTQLWCRRLNSEPSLEPDIQRWLLHIIAEQAQRLNRLVSQLLDVSRIQFGKLVLELQETDLASLVASTATLIQTRTGCDQIVIHAASPVIAWVDPLRIEQVVVNLIDNAVKFSPDGGQIDVDVSATEAGLVRLAVRDHGIGVPADKRERIFDRFHQAHASEHRSGLGLGLHISREIVELHGGYIAAEFPCAGGTRFVVLLPSGVTTREAAT